MHHNLNLRKFAAAIVLVGASFMPALSCHRRAGDLLPEFFLFEAMQNGRFSVGGHVTGLVGSQFILKNTGTRGVQTVALGAPATIYGFPSVYQSFDNYSVSIASYPSTPTQLCSLKNPSGTINGGSVGNVDISCQDAFLITGSVANLTGTGLQLTNNGGDLLDVPAGSTTFQFFTPVVLTGAYDVKVARDPQNPWQSCSFATAASGSVSTSANVSLPPLTCTNNEYPVTVSIDPNHPLTYSGLSLSLNGGAAQPVAALSTSATLGMLLSLDSYTITIASQPAGQVCALFGATGTVQGANVVATLGCSTNGYPVGGDVAGLSGTGLALTMTGAVIQPVSIPANATGYLFPTELSLNDAYTVTISVPPGSPSQDCSFVGGVTTVSGTATGFVTLPAITCTTISYPLDVTITNLSISGLQLTLDADPLPIIVPIGATLPLGSFPSGTTHTIQVTNQPSSTTQYQTCLFGTSASTSVTIGAGATSVALSCGNPVSIPALTVTVIGLAAPEFVTVTEAGAGVTVPPGAAKTIRTIPAGQPYSVALTGSPQGKVCAFKEGQYGTMGNLDLNLTVNCVPGQMVGGKHSPLPAARLNYHLYRGKATNLVGGKISLSRIAYANGELYYIQSNQIYHMATDGTGNLVFAGSVADTSGSTDGTGTGALLRLPMDLASDGTNLYFTEQGDVNGIGTVRRVNATTKVVKTIFTSSGGLDKPMTLALDQSSQILYISDSFDKQIYKLDLTTGNLTAFVTSASTAGRRGMVIIGSFLYVGGQGGIIERFNLSNGALSATFGSTAGFQDGECSTARFNQPWGLATDGSDLYVTDLTNNRIRKIKLDSGGICKSVSTIAGSGTASDSPGISTGVAASFDKPHGITHDGRNFYITTTGPTTTGGSIFKISDAGLVGYWPLNGTALDYNSDGSAINDASVNAGTATNGRYGETLGAYSYTGGLGSYTGIDSGVTSLPAGNVDRSLCVWVKPTSLPGTSAWYGIAGYGMNSPPPNQAFYIGLGQTSAGVHEVRIQAGGDPLTVPYTTSTSTWTHICGVHGNSIVKLFINGHLVGKASHTFATVNNIFTIGGWFMDTLGQQSIADVRIYSRALNEGEINELAQDAGGTAMVGASYNTGATGLLSHYGFDGAAVDTPAVDRGALGISLSSSPGPSGGPGSIVGKDGDSPGAYTYNGTTQYYANASTAGLPLGAHPRTMCAWAKPASQPGGANSRYPIISYGQGNPNGSEITYWYDSTGPSYKVSITRIGDARDAVIQLPVHTWSHICGINDGANSQVYVNGQQQSLATSGAQSMTTVAGPLQIGERTGTEQFFFNGAIDDVRIYNNALTAAQVRQIACEGLPGSADGCFSGGTVIAKDTAGAGNDGGFSVAINNSDEIAVGGSSYNSGVGSGAIWKYKENGAFDTGFNAIGYKTFSAVGTDTSPEVHGIAFDSTGSLVATGFSSDGASGNSFLMRYLSSGQPDTSFGSAGLVSEVYDNGLDVAIGPSGSIYYSGSGYGCDVFYDLYVLKYSSTGTYNWYTCINSSGNDGAGNGIAIDTAENIYVAGYVKGASDDFAVYKYSSAGNLVVSYPGGDGLAGTAGNLDRAEGVAIDKNGKIVAVGYSFNTTTNNDLVIMRLNPVDLLYDTTFSVDGWLTRDGINGVGSIDVATGVAVDSLNRIVVVGYSKNAALNYMFVCRYLSDGSIDSSFGFGDGVNDGCRVQNNAAGGNADDYALDVAIDSLNRIVVTGNSWNGVDSDMVVWRFLP